MSDAGAWALALGVLGAILGSFLATLTIRWPQGRSVMTGRSACDACGATLRWFELLPIISALAQRGRCRRCGAAIDLRHAVVEVLALVIGAAAGAVAPGGEGVAGAAFGWLLLTAAAIDASDLWLPDPLTATIALGGLLSGAVGFVPTLADRLIGGTAGFAALWLVGAGYRLWRGREGLGGGDPKLFGAIGLWLGWALLPAVLLIAGLLGLGIALWMRLSGRALARDTALPLGTLMAAAAYPAWLMMVGLGR